MKADELKIQEFKELEVPKFVKKSQKQEIKDERLIYFLQDMIVFLTVFIAYVLVEIIL